MFYFTPDGWKTHTKKISYTQALTVYDTDASSYLDNPKFQDVVVEDVALTPEQTIRLEAVKTLSTGIQDIQNYVINGTVNPENINLVKIVENSALQQLILKYIPKEELDNASLSYEPIAPETI